MSDIKCEKLSCKHNYFGNCRQKTVFINNQKKCGNYEEVLDKVIIEIQEGKYNDGQK